LPAFFGSSILLFPCLIPHLLNMHLEADACSCRGISTRCWRPWPGRRQSSSGWERRRLVRGLGLLGQVEGDASPTMNQTTTRARREHWAQAGLTVVVKKGPLLPVVSDLPARHLHILPPAR
jgi:hypothetical protein